MLSGIRDHHIPGPRELALGTIIAIAVFLALPSTTYAQKKTAKFGTIKILSTPGGLPLEVDGKSYGQTTTEFRSIDLDAGVHRIVVTLPSGKLWSREVDLPANRIKCVTLNYRPRLPPPPTSPCPFAINMSAPSQVSEGEVITYTTDVAYGGSFPLRYTWTVSPANASILSGVGTPTITVDSTGLDGQRITVNVVVDDGSGETACRQSVQAQPLCRLYLRERTRRNNLMFAAVARMTIKKLVWIIWLWNCKTIHQPAPTLWFMLAEPVLPVRRIGSELGPGTT